MKNSVWQKDMKLIGEALQATGCPAPVFSIDHTDLHRRHRLGTRRA